jgi:O-antigen ligase
MAYFFTFLFITTAYITPGVLFGPLGPYHIEIVFAVLAFLASIPSLGSSGLLRFPQTYAALGICFAAVVSIAAGGWLGGIPQICYSLLPVVAGFFLAAINCRKKWHIQLIVLSLFVCSVFYIAQGVLALRSNDLHSAYLYSNEAVPRVRGLGTVNDPNDFAQMMVSLIPLVFLWRSKSRIANVILVGVPIAVLIYGMFLTHSRGSSLALTAMIIVALRRKIGTIPAAILAGGLLAGILAAGWGAGRAVSIDTGEGRLDAWAAGLQYIKAHPLVGIGYAGFGDVYGMTAHNSVVVCAAEIGIPGFLCWVLFLFSTFRISVPLGSTEKLTEAQGQDAGRGPPVLSASELWTATRALATPAAMQLDADAASPAIAQWGRANLVAPIASTIAPEELRRIARLMTISLTGFLAAGWFLSRAFNIWLFLYCGIVCALLRAANGSGIQIERDPPSFLLRWSAGIGVLLLLIVYILLRVHNVVG